MTRTVVKTDIHLEVCPGSVNTSPDRIKSDAWFKEVGMDHEGMLRGCREDATLNP